MASLKSLSIATVSAVLLTLGTESIAQAILLGSGTLELNIGVGGYDIPFSDEFEVTTRLETFEVPGIGFFPSPSDPVLFQGTIITPSDVGKTFTATQEIDPEFNDFVSLLTNGTNNLLAIEYKNLNGFLGGGVGVNENFFTANPMQIDFLGNIIESISIQINTFLVSRTTSEDGFTNTSLLAEATLSINGQPNIPKPIPESSSALNVLLFAAFGAATVWKRRLYKSTR